MSTPKLRGFRILRFRSVDPGRRFLPHPLPSPAAFLCASVLLLEEVARGLQTMSRESQLFCRVTPGSSRPRNSYVLVTGLTQFALEGSLFTRGGPCPHRDHPDRRRAWCPIFLTRVWLARGQRVHLDFPLAAPKRGIFVYRSLPLTNAASNTMSTYVNWFNPFRGRG